MPTPLTCGRAACIIACMPKRVVMDRPCTDPSVTFEERDGGRFCLACREMQHDLRAVTHGEVLALLRKNGGRVCGTVRVAPSGEIRFRPEPPARAANASRAVALALTLAGCGASGETPEAESSATSPATPPSAPPPSIAAPPPSSVAVAPPPSSTAPAASTVPIDHSADASPDLHAHRTHAHHHSPVLVSGLGEGIDQYASGGLSISDMEPPPSGVGGSLTGAAPPAEERVRGRVLADYAHIAVHGDGAPEAAVVGRTLLARRAAVLACYERELRANPTLRGQVTFDATLDANGFVRATPTQDSTGDANIAACIAQVLHAVHFAGATGGGFSITYTLAPDE